MATYGTIRLSLAKQVPGLDPELLDDFILDTYQKILDVMSWERIQGSITIQTSAEVNAGTVTVTPGSQIIVGVGTAFAATMNGWLFRVAGGPEYYQFTFQDPVTGLLDRPYEGTSTGPGAGYQINQTIYPLPANTRYVEQVRNLDAGWKLVRTTTSELDLDDAGRSFYGQPCYWAPSFDQTSSPPIPQIEVYPAPDCVCAIALDCVFEDTAFGSSSSNLLDIWIRPACLKAGARSLCEAHLKDWNAAAHWKGAFDELLIQMVGIESMRHGPDVIRMATRFTQHRLARVTNISTYHRLP